MKLPPLTPDKIADIDYFIISMPKCGSTSLYNALRRIAPDAVMGFHSDHTVLRLHRSSNITIESLLDIRSFIDRPYYIFFPFREPISRKISQYYQYSKSDGKDIKTIKKEIREFCLGDVSLFNAGEITEIDENRNNPPPTFDKSLGYTHTVAGNINTIRFTLLSISNLEGYLQDILSPDFTIGMDMKSVNKNRYFEVKETIKFSEEELDKIYSKLCYYYYTDDQIDKFKDKYRR